MTYSDAIMGDGRFDWPKALGLATLSQLSYSDDAAALDQAAALYGVNIQPFNGLTTEGLVVSGPQAVTIAFRGSKGLMDWIVNAQVAASRYLFVPGAQAHSGFLMAYNGVRNLVAAAVGQLAGRKLWLTGHSLGGAIAMLAAAEYARSAAPGLMTFGQPKTVNRTGALGLNQLLNVNYRRFVFGSDVVTGLPPRAYSHAGDIIQFDRRNQILNPPTFPVSPMNLTLGASSREDVDLVDLPIEGPVDVTQAEYDALRALLVQAPVLSHKSMTADDGIQALGNAPAGALGGVFEQNIPALRDHRIVNYIDAIRAQLTS